MTHDPERTCNPPAGRYNIFVDFHSIGPDRITQNPLGAANGADCGLARPYRIDVFTIVDGSSACLGTSITNMVRYTAMSPKPFKDIWPIARSQQGVSISTISGLAP